MANISPAWYRVSPSYVLPEVIMQFQQASGAFELLGGSEPQVRLNEGDLYAYLRRFDIRTKVAAGQHAFNQLPSVSVVGTQLSTPTYLIRVRAEYDHHDLAASSNWGISLIEAQRLGMRQGIFQQMRNSLLYGFNPANGEGLVNTAGATTVTLPADPNGNTTVVTYDNGAMAIFLLTQVSAVKTRTMQLGLPARIVICGPQRILGAFEYQNIVQLTQFQRAGAGAASTKGMVQDVLADNKDSLEWVYDDTLIGQGAGGTDMVVVSMPEVSVPDGTPVNTNEFAQLTPSLRATSLMLCDMVAPREIPTPLAGGAIDVLSELRTTSGWGIRPEAISLISMPYQ